MNPFKLFIFLFLLSSCSSVSNEERMEEINIAEKKLQPHDTGHLHDYIANMNRRVEELDGE